MFASDLTLVGVSFCTARSRLAGLIRGGGLLAAAQEAYGTGLAGLSRADESLAPVLGMSRLVEVRSGDLVDRGDAVVVALRWEAIGPGGGLFPALDANLTLAAAGPAVTTVRLEGAYRLPQGDGDGAAAGLDRRVVRGVAAATIGAFLGHVGASIATPVPMTGTEGEGGRWARSWRPPEAEAL